MTRIVALFLVGALIGLPLAVAPTDTTLALAGVAGLFALVGVLLRNSPLLIAGVAVSLVEALLAFLQAAKPPNLLLALLLGVVIYLLLDISAFATTFRGVSIDTSVFRTKAVYWGWVAVLLGFTGLTVGLLAAALARPLASPLLPQVLAVLTAAIVVGAVLGASRVWQKKVRYFLDQG
jgi:hypothetical protein